MRATLLIHVCVLGTLGLHMCDTASTFTYILELTLCIRIPAQSKTKTKYRHVSKSGFHCCHSSGHNCDRKDARSARDRHCTSYEYCVQEGRTKLSVKGCSFIWLTRRPQPACGEGREVLPGVDDYGCPGRCRAVLKLTRPSTSAKRMPSGRARKSRPRFGQGEEASLA